MTVKRRSEVVVLKFVEERVETARAYLLVMKTGEEVWFPKSQIKNLDWDKGRVTVPRWLAEEKGLLEGNESGGEAAPPTRVLQ